MKLILPHVYLSPSWLDERENERKEGGGGGGGGVGWRGGTYLSGIFNGWCNETALVLFFF